MHRQLVRLTVVLLWASAVALQGQEFKVSDETVQVHGLASQGFVHTYDCGSGDSTAVTGDAPDSAVGDNGGAGKLDTAHALRLRFQVHGTLSQGFIYGSGNNYLTMDTKDGTAKWSEGAINFSLPIRDNFRAGIQLHSYIMGQLGRGTVQVDWAYADYRLKGWLGFRGGKLRAPLGLFGEVEDTDTLYNWALLPQSVYEAEYRSYNVPVLGGELYGSVKPGRSQFTLQLFGGRRAPSSNDGGHLLAWQLYGIETGATAGYTYGGDLKWETPIKGLTASFFLDRSRLFNPDGNWLVNPYGVPLALKIDTAIRREVYSLRYQRGKLDLAAEGKHEPHWIANTILGQTVPVLPSGSPRDAWYVMGAYHFTNKLTAGSYFSRVWGTSFIDTFRWAYYDPSKPEFYSQDTVVNTRYDINRFFYAKLEGHYIDGHLGGFAPATNPNGLQKVTRLAIARLGFTF